MNVYKTWFVFLGLIYVGLFMMAMAAPSKVSFTISLAGICACIAGWFMAERFL